jgi:hypothetical protein
VVGAKNDGLALRAVMDADLGRACHAIPPIPLPSVPVPGFNYACRGRGDVGLPEPVRVIAGAVDLGEPPALVKVGGQWANVGLTWHEGLLPLAKMAAILAFGFVIGAVVDYLSLGVSLYMVCRRVRDGCDA